MYSFTVAVYSAVTPTAINQTRVFLLRDQDKIPSLVGRLYKDPLERFGFPSAHPTLGNGRQTGGSITHDLLPSKEPDKELKLV